jgi:hypothetical protein
MKKFIVIAFALSLSGCASLQNIETAVQLGTASIANPITKTRLDQIESTATIVFAGLRAWKTSCQQGLIPVTCRDQIYQVQVFTRQVPIYLTQLRKFVKNNDQVNAIVVYNNLSGLIGSIKSQAAANGVNVGS